MTDVGLQLAAIVVLGVGAQLLADRLRLPSILLLLSVGIVAGPVTGWLEPDALFGSLLAPLVSYAVAIVLFEGGLGLRIPALAGVRRVMWSLVFVGAAVTMLASTLIGVHVMGLPLGIALLLASILVVSGPTVVGPLLRVVRPQPRVATVLEWEGIVIDPVGAMLAVIVFEAVLHERFEAPVVQVLRFLLCGAVVGAVVAAVMVVLLRRFWIPDFLRSSVTLAMVVLAFAVSNEVVEESGLLAVIVLGVVLANQRRARVRDIVEFSENLRAPLLAVLFIVLAARLELDEMGQLGWGTVVLVAALILVVRPLVVALSTIGSGLSLAERMVIAAVAPRGIVAASISSVFAIALADAGVAGAEELVPVTFAVIIVTVVVYGLGTPLLSRRLGVTRAEPAGVLVVGGDEFGRAVASAVNSAGGRAVLVPSNWSDHYLAQAEGIETHDHPLLDEHEELLEFEGLRTAVVLTENDEFNSLVALHLGHRFGPRHVYQLTADPERDEEATASGWKRTPARSVHVRGRWLFTRALTHTEFLRRVRLGWQVTTLTLTDERPWAAVANAGDDEPAPLFVIDRAGAVTPISPEQRAPLVPGNTVVAFVPPTLAVA